MAVWEQGSISLSTYLPTGQLLILMIYVVKCDFTLMMSCVSGCAIFMTRYRTCAKLFVFKEAFLENSEFCPYIWLVWYMFLSANRIILPKNENFKSLMFQFCCFIQVEFIIFLNSSFLTFNFSYSLKMTAPLH